MEETVTIRLDKYDMLMKELSINIEKIEALENTIEDSQNLVMRGHYGLFIRNYYTIGENYFVQNAIDEFKSMDVKAFKEWKKLNKC